MSSTKRSLEELNIIDDFLMSAAAADEEGGAEFCRLILSTLLGREIGEVQVNVQKVIPALTPGLRGLRMDVEVREETAQGEKGKAPSLRIYDIEPCTYGLGDIPRHNRFCQAKIDARGLVRGEREFSRLPDLYMVMILPYDPFGGDRMVYHVRNQCEEMPELDYEDGLTHIYFNTKGTKGGSAAIRELLHYFQESTEANASSETLQKIHRHVRKVKILPEVREEYMLWEEKIYYERKEAAEEAAKEAEKETRISDILEFLKEYGDIPEHLREKIQAEEDTDTLRRWVKLAAQAGSLTTFEEQM